MAWKRPIAWALGALAVFSLCDVIGPREFSLWKYFVFGILAAELIDHHSLKPLPATALAVVGLVFVVRDIHGGRDWIAYGIIKLSGGTLGITGGHPAYTLMLGLGVTLFLVGAVRAPIFRWVMESLPLRVLGAISYSLFMWHGLLVAADLPVTFDGRGTPVSIGQIPLLPAWYMPLVVIPGLIAAAAFSYVLIERPFLLMRSKPEVGPGAEDRLDMSAAQEPR